MIISTLIIIYKCIIIIIEMYYFYLDLLSFPVSSTIFLFTRVNSYYSVPQICTYIYISYQRNINVNVLWNTTFYDYFPKTIIYILLQIALSFSSSLRFFFKAIKTNTCMFTYNEMKNVHNPGTCNSLL